jgi:hypothetical protein
MFGEVFLCQRVNTATSSTADDVHNYVIPKKLLGPIFNKLPLFMRQWEQERLFSIRPALIADIFHVAIMARKHSVLNLKEINRNNTHIALALVLTYYG